jgi:hypothetical protein
MPETPDFRVVNCEPTAGIVMFDIMSFYLFLGFASLFDTNGFVDTSIIARGSDIYQLYL